MADERNDKQDAKNKNNAEDIKDIEKSVDNKNDGCDDRGEDVDFRKKLEEMLNDDSIDELLGGEDKAVTSDEVAEKEREIEALKAELAEKDKKIKQLSDENKRLKELAKSANRQRERLQEQFNQRSEREIQKFIKEHYLPTVDNLEQALDYIEGEKDLEGIKGILANCYNDLASLGIVKIEAEGQKFDPNYHDALAIGCDEEKADNVVLVVRKNGYKNNRTGELVRPAEVIVNKRS